jgi:DNA-binding MarR family transcriptional regulator
LKNSQSTDKGGKMSEIVDNTERIYAYLVAEWTEHSRIPTYREIAKDCDLAVTTVVYHLDKLEGQGRIVREANKARSIRLTTEEQEADAITEQVYQFIRDVVHQGQIPTQQEIAQGCYLSRVTVRRHLAQLEEQGRIIIGDGMRDVRLVQK